jgi:hypothetical protein
MKTTIFAFLMLFAANLAAQTFSIEGKITDDTGTPLPGAHVALQYPWGDDVQAVVSEPSGRFKMTKVEKGGYKIKVSFLGFEPFLKEVTLTDRDVNLGTLQLAAGSTVLQEVEVKERIPMANQQGDTVQFNADAFKVMKDANAQELLEKMPTVTVEGGQVKAQGDNIQQVLVDGKPFFGNDPTAALRNLPAEVIDKIQIFDQQSEQSQFTGFNDGSTTKTINIVTKKGMNNGQFGKIYAGYGYEDKYQAGGNFNFFDGDRRISLIGMTNNINIQNFSIDDILGATGSGGSMRLRGGGFGGGRPPGGGGGRGGRSFGGGGSLGDFLVQPQGGIATTHAFGINYSDKWGKKLEVTGSYFFNKSKSDAESLINRQFVDEEGFGEVYAESSVSNSDNINHRANFRIEYQLDSANSFVFRPRVTWQMNEGASITLGRTDLDGSLLNKADNFYNSDFDGLNFNSSLLWRHKFSKPRRTFSVDVSSGYAPKKGESSLQSNNAYFFPPPALLDTLDQRSSLDVNSWNLASNFEYTEPVGENAQLSLNYRASYQQEESDKSTFDYNEATSSYNLLNLPLTNVFSNDYFTQSAGTGYSYNKGRDLNLSLRANFQWAKLVNDQTYPFQREFDQTFYNVLPSATLRYNFNQQRNIRISYRTNTDLPSIEQLQNVVDNSNPLQLKTGNPNLDQSFQHNLFMRYQATNPEKSTVFFAMIGGSLTSNYIANSTYLANSGSPLFDSLDVQPGAQITQPVNLDGHRSVRSFITYGVPIKPIKSNLNFNLSWNYTRTPGSVNDQINYADNHTFGAGFTLASNISDKVDFTLAARPSWSRVNNSLQTTSNTEYLSNAASLRFNWIIIEGFVLRTDLTSQVYTGLSESFNQNYWLWNLGIGKKIFKNERGEITLAVNDLLKQNQNISRSVTETYIEDSRTNALQRFFMLSFTYNLRHFNTGKESTRSQERREWEGRF